MKDLTIAAAQAASVPGDVGANVEHHGRLAELAASRGARLVVFPELSLTAYELGLASELAFSPLDDRLKPLQETAEATSAILVVGAPVRLASGLHIGAFVLEPGRSARLYTKRHLAPGEEAVFVAGSLDPLIQIDSEAAALAICADTTHASHAAAAAERGAGIYLAGVFFTPDGIAANRERLSGHASRHGMVVAMANAGARASRFASAGNSSIWSPDGTRVACLHGLGAGLAVARRSQEGWVGGSLRL